MFHLQYITRGLAEEDTMPPVLRTDIMLDIFTHKASHLMLDVAWNFSP